MLDVVENGYSRRCGTEVAGEIISPEVIVHCRPSVSVSSREDWSEIVKE